MKILLILLSTLMMNACGCQKKATENNMKTKIAASNQQEKLSGIYTVQVLENAKIANKKVTLNFNPQQNRVSGFSGCNAYSGVYTENNGTIKFGNMVATKMYCKDGSKTEASFMEALSKVTSFNIKEGTLVLKSDTGNILEAHANHERVALQENNNIVSYVSSTRGYFLELTLQENKLLVKKDRNSKKGELIAVSNEDMKIVKSLITEINLETINQLEAPTKMRQYDGAAHANISITQNGEVFRGAGFDGGHPPKELEALVNKIIALSEIK